MDLSPSLSVIFLGESLLFKKSGVNILSLSADDLWKIDNDHVNLALCRNMSFVGKLSGETFLLVDKNTVAIGSLGKSDLVFKYHEWIAFDNLCPKLKRLFISLDESPLL